MEIKEVNAGEAYEALKNGNVALIDVRTDAENIFVGRVDLDEISGKSFLIPWKVFPGMAINPRFQIMLEKGLRSEFPEDEIHDLELIFMCRSGGRSLEAAMYCTQLGFKNCSNLIFGFEGGANEKGHRSRVSGWIADGLPWKQ